MYYTLQTIAVSAVLLFGACSSPTSSDYSDNTAVTPQHQRPFAYKTGKYFEKDNKRFLYGGPDSTWHFDVTNMELNEKQFHYGIGREVFPALIHPKFQSIKAADTLWNDSAEFLLAIDQNVAKAYAIQDLLVHEIVNDHINGHPIMAAYCVLSDLAAIYDRKYGADTLTFALSGYTYFDSTIWNGADAFVFWDRETESLWWPLIDRAISGSLKGVELRKWEEKQWKRLQWKTLKQSFPHAQIMVSGQTMETPTHWKQISNPEKLRKEFSKKETDQ